MSSFTRIILLFLFWQLLLCRQTQGADAPGHWQLLQNSTGSLAMHMQLLKHDRVVIFDRTDFGYSNLTLPNGRCRYDPYEKAVKWDCTAHSLEYDPVSNSFRALFVQTNVWCSSGSVTADGQLIQTGGYNDGERTVRTFDPCYDCDWKEVGLGLAVTRWYSTSHRLPDGRQIIVGGTRQFNYEFYPKTPATSRAFYLPFLAETYDKNVENNLYPFVHLNVDGNLFIFANNRAILFDYVKNEVVKTYPEIPGGDPRNYPSTGSSVLLPLKNLQEAEIEAEVLVCGGAPKGSILRAQKKEFVKALDTCGRIKITDLNPEWVMDTMPLARVMGDMILLPNGNVLIINGGAAGTAGWEYGREPVLNPVMYRPDKPIGSRFQIQKPTTIPRMYHSAAILLRDGKVLVGGSNPHEKYKFTSVLFPTELSLEAFSPAYVDAKFSKMRPEIVYPAPQSVMKYGEKLLVDFTIAGPVSGDLVSVTMVSPSFTTHSFSMNQRLLVLGDNQKMSKVGDMKYRVEVTAPGSGNVAPSGYYMLFVVYQEVPSEGIWVKIH